MTPDGTPDDSANLEVLAVPDAPAPAVEPTSRPVASAKSGNVEPKARQSQAPEELKKDAAPENRQPEAPGPSPPAISEIPDWVPLVGGFNSLPAKAVARGGVELWRKTRVVAGAIGAAPVGVLLFGVALHRAKRRRPWLESQDAERAAGAHVD